MLKEPFETKYLKWKHTERDYVVEIVTIRNVQCSTGYYAQIVTRKIKSEKTMVWSAEVFTLKFKPHGRKLRAEVSLDSDPI